MRRDGFLLGVIATGSQVLLLRELISSLQGDELFICTTLCGWLLWGALGAYIYSKGQWAISNSLLFALAALILPLEIIAARLSPLMVSTTVGEAVSISHATLISLIITLPVSFICGCLFAAIVRREGNDGASLIRIYFNEGVGAFVAGVLVAFLTSNNVSTLSTAGAVLFLLLAASTFGIHRIAKIIGVTAGIGAAIAVIFISPKVDKIIDTFKYRPYNIIASFDTPYSHQTILQRGGAHTLLTDNMVESVEGDIQTGENLLLPPLAYAPNAKDVLIFGQVDLTIHPILAHLPNLSLTEVDTRPPLEKGLTGIDSHDSLIKYVQNDPIAFLRTVSPQSFDIIAFSLDESGSYKGLRLLTNRALTDIRRALRSRGVLLILTNCNSEEYISADDKELLSSIRVTLESHFPRVMIWPGGSTLFLAGDSTLENLQPDLIAARLDRFDYEPQFINETYLFDRLSQFQVERIDKASRSSRLVNSVERPILANLQITRRSRIYAIDHWIAVLFAQRRVWGIAMICLAILFLGFSAIGHKKRWLGLVIYFSAGLISLSLELISFYVYQSIVGALYSHLSLLVGTFMLGLAIGTMAANEIKSRMLAPFTLIFLTTLTVIFMATCINIPIGWALLYHGTFQFLVAFCTAALFVAATRRYLSEATGRGGIGYAVELAGSSIGALVTMPLLLPTVGLHWLLGLVALMSGSLIIITLSGSSAKL